MDWSTKSSATTSWANWRSTRLLPCKGWSHLQGHQESSQTGRLLRSDSCWEILKFNPILPKKSARTSYQKAISGEFFDFFTCFRNVRRRVEERHRPGARWRANSFSDIIIWKYFYIREYFYISKYFYMSKYFHISKYLFIYENISMLINWC